MSVTARMHRLGLYLRSKDRQLLRNITKKSVITNSKQLKPKKSADSYKDNYGDRNWNFVKLINEVLQRWRNYGNSRVLPSILLREEKLIEDQNTILELSGRVQELQNEVNCMNDSKDFQDAESVRSGNSHVSTIPEGMLRHSFVTPSRREGPPSVWDTHGISGNVFANPPASSSAPFPQELNQWNSSIEEPLHTSAVEKNERPEQNQDLRVILSGGDPSKNYGADRQRLQISDLHFDKFRTPATFACWKIRFKTEVCTCSQFHQCRLTEFECKGREHHGHRRTGLQYHRRMPGLQCDQIWKASTISLRPLPCQDREVSQNNSRRFKAFGSKK